jgi:chorismate mutase
MEVMMNKEIQKNRDKIDVIDNQIFDLLIDRLDAVTTIGYIKKEEGFPVLDQNRENAIYAKIDAKFSAIEADFLKNIYQSIITESKRVEGK